MLGQALDFWNPSHPEIYFENIEIFRILCDSQGLELHEISNFNGVVGLGEEWFEKRFSFFLQHYGVKTNLIDVTQNIYIALFFSSNKDLDKDGRVILIDKNSEKIKHRIDFPYSSNSRIKNQYGGFIRASKKGFIDIDSVEIVTVPKEIKEDLLNYLSEKKDISKSNVYPSIWGFIQHHADYGTFYFWLQKGWGYLNKVRFSRTIDRIFGFKKNYLYKSEECFYQALKRVTHSVWEMERERWELFTVSFGLGKLFWERKEYRKAIKYFTDSIENNKIEIEWSSWPNEDSPPIAMGWQRGKELLDEQTLCDSLWYRCLCYCGVNEKQNALEDFDKILLYDKNYFLSPLFMRNCILGWPKFLIALDRIDLRTDH